MKKYARGFMAAAIVYGLVGIALGLMMAIAEDHAQIPTHAHANLIGWVSFFLFALYYQFFGEGVPRALAMAHFWSAQVSVPVLMVAIFLVHSGETQFVPLAAISSLAYAASFVIFAIIVLPKLFAAR